MNLKRWLIVGFISGLMVFSFAHLSSAGSDYRELTTSDSGFFYCIARDIKETDGMVTVDNLSHPPQGLPIARFHQLQPLMAVVLYHGAHSVNPDVTLMDTVQYFGPLLFALTLIAVFLIGKELGGNLAGCAAAFFMSTIVASIYWTKIGAFDREITQLFFISWVMYLTVRMFKAPRKSIAKYSVLAGLVYGLFALSWPGFWYIGFIIIGGLILVLLNGIIVHEGSARSIEGRIFAGIRANLHLILGVVGMLGITTVVAWSLGGYSPLLWFDQGGAILGILGIGAGGVGITPAAYATEMAAPTNFSDPLTKFYGSELLVYTVFILFTVAILKICWSRGRGELLLLPWLLIAVVMSAQQSRFFRMWWPMVPVFAGLGLATLARLWRHLISVPEMMTSKWSEQLQQPVALAIVACLFMTPFIINVRANATETDPPPHGGTAPSVYHSLLDCFKWIEENTPEDSIIAIEWSYGHFMTGAANRQSVTDGSETKGEDEEWKDEPGSKPPDYIRYVADHQEYIYGVNVSAKSDDINGRRIDVFELYTTGDENRFAWILETYRDNYNCRIDYVVFNFVRESGALTANTSGVKSFENYALTDGGQYVFYQFDNENVSYDGNITAYLQEGETWSPLGILFYDTGRNRVTSWYFAPQWHVTDKILVVYHRYGSILTTDGIPVVGLGDLISVPMVSRARHRYEVPEYMEEAYRSPHGQASVYRIDHIPRLTSPADGAATNNPVLTLEWTSSIGGVKYELAVDNNPDFLSPEVLENTSNLSYAPDNALPDDTYRWRVRAFNDDNDTTGWSENFAFTIDTAAPSAPSLESPADNAATSDNTPTFNWSLVSDAESYNLQVDNNADFSSPEINESDLTDNTYTVAAPGLADDNYSWHVRARDAAGNESDWSPTWTFTIQT